MNKLKIILLFTIAFFSCRNENDNPKMNFIADEIPNNIPFEFKQNLVPENKLIHKGIFSPDLKEYYYTISDNSFEKFDVLVIKKNETDLSVDQLNQFNQLQFYPAGINKKNSF